MKKHDSGLRHEKDLYAVYPIHIENFRGRFNLKVTEMTALLGITSPQDWHKMKAAPGERVKNPVTCALLRAYSENPDWLSEMGSFRRATKKLYRMFRKTEGYSSASAIFGICQIYDKSENVLRKWYKGASRPTLAALKLTDIVNQLSGKALQDFVSDARLSTIPQVNGQDVKVLRDQEGLRWYRVADDEGLYTFEEIVKRCAVPGARRPRQEVADEKTAVDPDSQPSALPAGIEDETPAEDDGDPVAKASRMAARLSWHPVRHGRS